MKVDLYTSETKTNTSIIVPTETDLASLTGAAAATVDDLKPWALQLKNHNLTRIATGDLLDFLEKQIAESGAGKIITTVSVEEHT